MTHVTKADLVKVLLKPEDLKSLALQNLHDAEGNTEFQPVRAWCVPQWGPSRGPNSGREFLGVEVRLEGPGEKVARKPRRKVRNVS